MLGNVTLFVITNSLTPACCCSCRLSIPFLEHHNNNSDTVKMKLTILAAIATSAAAFSVGKEAAKVREKLSSQRHTLECACTNYITTILTSKGCPSRSCRRCCCRSCCFPSLRRRCCRRRTSFQRQLRRLPRWRTECYHARQDP